MVLRLGNKRNKKRVAKKPQGFMQKVSGTTLGQVWNQIKLLKNLINVEFKYLDTSGSGVVDNAGALTYLTGIAEGDDISNRNGRSIKSQSLFVKMRLVINASATGTCIRHIIVMDKHNQGATPTVTDILQTASVESSLNISTQQNRWHILSDEVISLTTSGGNTKYVERFYPWHAHIKYGGTTANVSDARFGAIFMLQISSEAINTPTSVYNIRYRYVDN